ncbi:protein of unknown function [Microlunatus flavus]|uniref:TLP18.3, Psb32 and MOLO-1 founding protein of phosphatase n=1 Tax=Microlunatus flavus TaxID=1036181 RepID=A0A1H9CUF5_9ACTN|nr:protein of unknown function [Microlunatus flavus]
MLAGDDLTPADAKRLRRAVEIAEEASGLRFALYLGGAEDDARADALRLHGSLEDAASTVLVLCDPDLRVLEIVTGTTARRALSDRDCALAAASMRSSFVAGDIVGGLSHGITQMGEAARRPTTLHARTEDD